MLSVPGHLAAVRSAAQLLIGRFPGDCRFPVAAVELLLSAARDSPDAAEEAAALELIKAEDVMAALSKVPLA
jgi:hypothetical protein